MAQSKAQRLRNIERDAATTKRMMAHYAPGGMGHRILTKRIERLREDWRSVRDEK